MATVTLREFVLPGLPGASGLVLFNFAILALVFLRWRSRIRLDEEGVEWRRSKQTVVTRLRWDEVEELFLLGRDGFEVRGAGRSVRLSRGYRIPWNARDLCSDRLAGLRDRLRDRALRDGQLVFRMPTARLRAHAAYLAAILFLTGLTGLILAPLFRPGRLGFPVFIVIFGGSWLWGLRRRASRLGTIVTLDPVGGSPIAPPAGWPCAAQPPPSPIFLSWRANQRSSGSSGSSGSGPGDAGLSSD